MPIDHRMRMNVFFSKWLEYLCDQGHTRGGLSLVESLAASA